MSESRNNNENIILNDLSKPQRLNKILTCKKRRSQKISFKDHFVEYTQNTSLHGFKYLGMKDNTTIDKIWWFVMILISISTSAYLINIVWAKWQQTPVIVTFAENSIDISSIPFPAITICPDIKVRQTVYNFTEGLHNLTKENNTLSDEELSQFNSMAVLCDNGYFAYEKFNISTDESIIDDIIRVSPRLGKSLYKCKINIWDNATRSFCKSHFNEILTDDGLCFTYNMLDSKEIYNENTIQYNYNFTINKTNGGWEYDTGYGPGVDINTYPQRGIGPGLPSAIRVFILRNPLDFDKMCAGLISGIKVTIHPPNVIPRMSKHFFWVPVNKEMTIAVKPGYMTTSEQLRKYTPEKRGCYFSHERRLKFFKNYNKENCELECLTNYTMAVCNCADYSMPRDKEMPICSLLDETCQLYASEILFLDKHEYDLEYTNYSKWVNYSEESRKIALECNCLSSCTAFGYEADISQTQYFEQKINGKDVSAISVYFKDSNFIPTKRSELYGTVDFLASCGGLLGLCLGFSILSLIEIMYYLTLRLYIKPRK